MEEETSTRFLKWECTDLSLMIRSRTSSEKAKNRTNKNRKKTCHDLRELSYDPNYDI